MKFKMLTHVIITAIIFHFCQCQSTFLSRLSDGDEFNSSTTMCFQYDGDLNGNTCKCKKDNKNMGTLLTNQNGQIKCTYNGTGTTGCQLMFTEGDVINYIDTPGRSPIGILSRNSLQPLTVHECLESSINHVERWEVYWEIFERHRMHVVQRNKVDWSSSPASRWQEDFEGYLFKISLQCKMVNGSTSDDCVFVKFNGRRSYDLGKIPLSTPSPTELTSTTTLETTPAPKSTTTITWTTTSTSTTTLESIPVPKSTTPITSTTTSTSTTTLESIPVPKSTTPITWTTTSTSTTTLESIPVPKSTTPITSTTTSTSTTLIPPKPTSKVTTTTMYTTTSTSETTAVTSSTVTKAYEKPPSDNFGLIIGLVVCISLLLVCILVMFYCFSCKKRSFQQDNNNNIKLGSKNKKAMEQRKCEPNRYIRPQIEIPSDEYLTPDRVLESQYMDPTIVVGNSTFFGRNIIDPYHVSGNRLQGEKNNNFSRYREIPFTQRGASYPFAEEPHQNKLSQKYSDVEMDAPFIYNAETIPEGKKATSFLTPPLPPQIDYNRSNMTDIKSSRRRGGNSSVYDRPENHIALEIVYDTPDYSPALPMKALPPMLPNKPGRQSTQNDVAYDVPNTQEHGFTNKGLNVETTDYERNGSEQQYLQPIPSTKPKPNRVPQQRQTFKNISTPFTEQYGRSQSDSTLLRPQEPKYEELGVHTRSRYQSSHNYQNKF